MSFSQPEPNTLYISLTFLSKDSRKNYYHWTLYATGNNPPEGTKFHATDHGNSKNPLKYEDGRVVNPLRSKNLVVCLKVGYADSHQAIRQSLKKVPLGSSRALPRRESRWSCLVFLLQGLKQLNDDGLIFLPPDLDLAGIEAACYKHADYYYRIKEQDRNSSTPPEVINNNLWLQMENSPSRAGQPSNYYQTYAQPSHQGTVRMDTDRSYRGPTYYPTNPMETETAGRYLGPSPMETEPHGYYSHYRSGSRY